MSGDLKSEGLTSEGDLTFLVFKSESARFDFLHSEVDPGIQVLHPEVNLGIQVLNPEVDLGIQILHSEADLGISEAAGNHVVCECVSVCACICVCLCVCVFHGQK